MDAGGRGGLELVHLALQRPGPDFFSLLFFAASS